MNDYRVSSFHHEFRRETKPDFAEEERRAAESSEQRETRLARRRVADSLLPLVASE